MTRAGIEAKRVRAGEQKQSGGLFLASREGCFLRALFIDTILFLWYPETKRNLQRKQAFKMTTIYFVRHAEPNYMNHNDMLRELTRKGLEDSKLVTRFLADKEVDVVFSSPYKRAIDTIRDFSEARGLVIHLENDFRERKVDSGWIEDFTSFCKAQWMDFDYKLSDGETLREVQTRNITALNRLLNEHRNSTIVVGTHGTALSTIIQYYNKQFGYADFEKIKGLMPWVVKFTFENDICVEMQAYNLFELRQ